MDELGRIIEADNKRYSDQLKARWGKFYQNALFFGAWKKALKPPMGLDECKHKTNSNMYSTSHL